MKQLRGFMAGLLAGLILAGITAFAANLDVILNYARVQIDGVDVTSDNFYVDGKTYVWIRDVASMFGKDVEWNEEAKTANIVDKKPTYVPIETDDTVALSVGSTEVTVQELKSLAVNYLNTGAETDIKTAVARAKDAATATAAAAEQEKLAGNTGEDYKAVYEAAVQSYLTAADAQTYIDFLNANLLTDALHVNIMVKYELENQYLEKVKEKITDEEIKAYYEEHKEEVQQVTAKHILIQNSDTAEKEINDIYNTIKRKNNFDEMMNEHSQDPGLATNPDGYTFGKGEMVAPFEEAAFSQEVGKLYPPVKTDYGYHLVLVTARDESWEANRDACIEAMLPEWYPKHMLEEAKTLGYTENTEAINAITL